MNKTTTTTMQIKEEKVCTTLGNLMHEHHVALSQFCQDSEEQLLKQLGYSGVPQAYETIVYLQELLDSMVEERSDVDSNEPPISIEKQWEQCSEDVRHRLSQIGTAFANFLGEEFDCQFSINAKDQLLLEMPDGTACVPIEQIKHYYCYNNWACGISMLDTIHFATLTRNIMFDKMEYEEDTCPFLFGKAFEAIKKVYS